MHGQFQRATLYMQPAALALALNRLEPGRGEQSNLNPRTIRVPAAARQLCINNSGPKQLAAVVEMSQRVQAKM